MYRLTLFALTQLYLEINDKYVPGVFLDILAGKYLKPRIENRIIMFKDLKGPFQFQKNMGTKIIFYLLYNLFIIYYIN